MTTSKYFEIVNKYLVAYLDNDKNTLEKIVDQNIKAVYSTIGKIKGKKELIEKLYWKEEYDIRTVTTTNVMSYYDNGYIIIGLIAHHLIANERNRQFYPLSFGGKYVFKLNKSDAKIEDVYYAQEYQVENTMYIKSWEFAKRIPDLAAIHCFDLQKMLTQADNKSLEERLREYTYIYFWALDTRNEEVLRQMSKDDLHMLRYKTMSYGKFEFKGIEGLSNFIDENRNYYMQDNFSITIRKVLYNEDKIIVKASHLLPSRTGTKKLNINTKYHTFYDEEIFVTFEKEADTYKVADVAMEKLADVQLNGYKLLRL